MASESSLKMIRRSFLSQGARHGVTFCRHFSSFLGLYKMSKCQNVKMSLRGFENNGNEYIFIYIIYNIYKYKIFTNFSNSFS